MDEMRGIPPVAPVPPRRAVKRRDEKQRREARLQQQAPKKPAPRDERDDDGQPHIDEYA